MELIEIAQLVTGTATLIVALILVYQLRQQHKDSDSSMSFQAVNLHNENQRWFSENYLKWQKYFSYSPKNNHNTLLDHPKLMNKFFFGLFVKHRHNFIFYCRMCSYFISNNSRYF